MPPAIVTAVQSRQNGDCGIVALEWLTGQSYDTVLAAVVRRYPRRWRPGIGLTVAQLTRVAADLGCPLVRRARFDDETYGLILTPGHVAILRAGHVIETDGTGLLWELSDWLAHRSPTRTSVLLPRGGARPTPVVGREGRRDRQRAGPRARRAARA